MMEIGRSFIGGSKWLVSTAGNGQLTVAKTAGSEFGKWRVN